MFVLLLDFVYCKLIHVRYLATVQGNAFIYPNDIKYLIDLRWILDDAIEKICIPLPLLTCAPKFKVKFHPSMLSVRQKQLPNFGFGANNH